tara:strand:+ start:3919 stop:4074 length:156 start_codon:yes stop_codon:yes gene_type:complete
VFTQAKLGIRIVSAMGVAPCEAFALHVSVVCITSADIGNYEEVRAIMEDPS